MTTQVSIDLKEKHHGHIDQELLCGMKMMRMKKEKLIKKKKKKKEK
eukprot:CAMPEP_0114365130 /NCGR_PEP_ID=MMETSP0101-20121206/28137_1 /TAXON_ID=38822 ORGANISM="Pteridomonas danica, Strain PT" /NCGR_SAMPLE_ID=MMETSP0101 /ASSEMBLY_ACC=CAM_ASM_000211 /LENGTH=45 /DNA_ID= /DNA_START= /DNA_END= /DNA_ORIENTATION=